MGDKMNRPLLIFGFILFYSFLTLIYGLYGDNINSEDYGEEYGDVGTTTFLKNVVTGIRGTPWWLNLILIVPMSIFFGYLVLVGFINPGG